MGKPEFKSPRFRNPLIKTRPLTRSKTACVRSSANVKVIVRVRPPNAREQENNHRTVIKILDERMLVFDPKANIQPFFYHGVEQKGRDLMRKANKDLQFVFDHVFGFEANNAQLFEKSTQDLIKSLMDGCNCSVFAYGATGAGKTHTMIGNAENPGITYLTVAELFKAKQELSSERNFELAITYLEVYNELVQDLLNPGSPLQLRDDGKYGVTVAGIKVHKIENPEDLFSLLAQGNSNRTQHPTDANAESSRSHAVFQVYIQMEIKATREVRAAKLSMIDLAGSERGSVTGFGGARFTEGANINKSLLALGNCINSLADGQKYVPYRDSKLTRLLKDSLGGNCQTVMIANISPSSMTYEDTYNTLKYATRAKKIKAEVKRNVVNVELHAGEYVKIVEDLKKELERTKAQLRERSSEVVLDPELAMQVAKLMEQRTKLVERTYNVECSEHLVTLRRLLKEDADSRLSGLVPEQSDITEAHLRLGKTVDRFQRQEDTFKAELTVLKTQKVDLESRTQELVKKHPEVQKLVELETEKLIRIETQYHADLVQKKFALIEDEFKSRGNLLEKTCKMLKSCYLQLKGHGFATDVLCQQYQDLVNRLQGRRNITWDDGGDSGLSSTASMSSIESEVRPPKRRMVEVTSNVAIPLDGTFVMEAPKPTVNVCANKLMAKVYEASSGGKRPAKIDTALTSKENRKVAPARLRATAMVGRKVLSKVDLKKRPFRS